MYRKKTSIVAVFQLLTAGGIILFWIGFFTIGLAPENPPPCYYAFEHSFPIPDMLLALALVFSGILVLKERRPGKDLALVSSGALIFLGLLDTSFNLQNGMYTISITDTLLNGFVNAYCVIFGLISFVIFKDA